MEFDWVFALILAGTSLATAALAIVLLPLIPRFGIGRTERAAPAEMIFLFDGDQLVDATPEGRQFLSTGPAALPDWPRFLALAGPRFPGLAERIARLEQDGTAILSDTQGAARLQAEWIDGVARLTMHLPGDAVPVGLPDAQSLAAMTAELTTLRDVVEAMPTPAWLQDEEGGVAWANSAYLALVRAQQPAGTPLAWPLPALFPPHDGSQGELHREAVHLADNGERWFDCVSVMAEGTQLNFALPADATVRAETALRNFVQTLTKTFAELPIGLAVFNRARELVLFNPAMSDLFNLEPEFLTARPTLVTVLDRLRETRMMPEPKNYKSWREDIVKLERDARDGIYADTWTLPNGQVYRVTGRPHPDGAVAFLFEDITAEMSLTRRFRGEIEIGQSVIDSFDDALAVFSNGGVLAMSNTAYSELWGDDPLLVLGTLDIAGATACWQESCVPEETGTVVELARHLRQRKPWSGTLVHADGRRLGARLTPIAGGATLVAFRPQASERQDEADPPKVSRAAG